MVPGGADVAMTTQPEGANRIGPPMGIENRDSGQPILARLGINGSWITLHCVILRG